MGAIWGIINCGKNADIDNRIKAINDEYARKVSFDRYDYVSRDKATFGCGIIEITDEDALETMPIVDEKEGIVFVADCMLDNRDELIEALDIKESCSDGFIAYKSYLKWGQDCAKYLLGSFSIAIWDEKNEKLILMSDYTSSRCLYYYKTDDSIYFSTLLSPIQKAVSYIDINENYIKDFLLISFSNIYNSPGETHLKDVYLLRPARRLTFLAEELIEEKYWNIEDTSLDLSGKNKDEILNTFMGIYDTCIKSAIRSNKEIAVTLSAGLDSSSIAALACKNLGSKTLHSYTYVPFEKVKRKKSSNSIIDESEIVYEIADMYPNIKTNMLTNEGKNAFEDIEELLSISEMPFKTAPFANFLEICRKAKEDGCNVVLEGAYGNTSLSFGELENILYNFYKKKDSASIVKYCSNYCMHENIEMTPYMMKHLNSFKNYDDFVKAGGSVFDNFVPDTLYISSKILKDYNLKERLSQDKRSMLSGVYFTENEYKDYLLSETLQMNLGVFNTKFALSTGIMIKDPTKDKRLLEFCYKLPFEYFAYEGCQRFLIREGFKDLLPKSVTNNWSGRGLQLADWMERISRDWDGLKFKLIEIINATKLSEDIIQKKDILEFIKNFNPMDEGLQSNMISVFVIINVTILLEMFTETKIHDRVSLEIFINEKVTGGNSNENLDERRAYGIRYRRDSVYR